MILHHMKVCYLFGENIEFVAIRNSVVFSKSKLSGGKNFQVNNPASCFERMKPFLEFLELLTHRRCWRVCKRMLVYAGIDGLWLRGNEKVPLGRKFESFDVLNTEDRTNWVVLSFWRWRLPIEASSVIHNRSRYL